MMWSKASEALMTTLGSSWNVAVGVMRRLGVLGVRSSACCGPNRWVGGGRRIARPSRRTLNGRAGGGNRRQGGAHRGRGHVVAQADAASGQRQHPAEAPGGALLV